MILVMITQHLLIMRFIMIRTAFISFAYHPSNILTLCELVRYPIHIIRLVVLGILYALNILNMELRIPLEKKQLKNYVIILKYYCNMISIITIKTEYEICIITYSMLFTNVATR